MRTNKLRTLGGVFGLAILGLAPVTAKAETLADALKSAYVNSGLLEQNRALLRSADENVAQAVASLRPIIDWTSGITLDSSDTRSQGANRNNTSTSLNLGITGSLLVYDFGRSDFLTESAKETVLATRQTLISVEQFVLLTGVQAYMNVIRNQEFVDLRQNNLRLLREELRAAQDRFEVGEVTRTDVAQAESAVALAQSGLAAAQGDLTRAIEEFREAIGRDPGSLQTPSELPQLGENVDAAKAAALRRHPDLLQAQHNVAAAELNIRAAEAALLPTLNLTARVGASEELDGSDMSRTGSLGVEMRGPIYRGGRLTSQQRQAMAQRDAQLALLHLAGLQVKQDVGDSYANLRAARASRTASREAVRAAQVAFDGTREEATLGARTTLDVLDAEQDLLDARANLISANADVVIAAYSVLASIGELTARDLNLGVQTYDPAAYYELVKDAPIESSPQGQKLDRVLRALGKN
ncbi:type I secretion outer membrane protein, TolC family [Roseovarius sp. TM1035]|uniref:Outer membrane efflux protein BepC n=1 Tax=Roseovarius mucosus TaxID=215743 RepID=A0A1V0RUD5_9RHOB|nr:MULTISPECIES: TolC family outer membrane protein [Roseovarius]ARE85397.1 outer membrane efflux protein BepC [Roseovarius mucosus]EDM30982.1 type I secretion outer membrane protein, TolC family [Roseovarius sp. TM1035]MBW4974949.1 TolC family outer membrane protein [Roseovarius mucosus]|tara:strand:+ start:2681 stop:4087 length:1407 start_codon:yes stop_codon:yes gene_type:complete